MNANQAAVLEATAEAEHAALKYQSQYQGVNTSVAAATAQLKEGEAAQKQAAATIATVQAQLQLAQYYLDNTLMVAPADGYIVNLQVEPGMVAGIIRMGGIASFIEDDDRYLLASFSQETLKYVKPGQSAEIAINLYPGQVFEAKVDSIWWANGEGQYLPSDNLPKFYPSPPDKPQGEFVVKIYPKYPSRIGLPIGAQGAATIYARRVADSQFSARSPSASTPGATGSTRCHSDETPNSSRQGKNRHASGAGAALPMTILTTLAISLGGCALHKPPQPSAILTQALPKATPLPPAWTSSPNTADVSDDWVKSFHDPGLESVVSEAIANNLDLRQSAARVEAARANITLVGSKLKPQIRLDVNGSTTNTSQTTLSSQQVSNTAYGEFTWEADVWGRLRSQRAAAQQSYEANALDYAFARQSLAATTAKSWYLAIETHHFWPLPNRAYLYITPSTTW